jgi:hypothetical protein
VYVRMALMLIGTVGTLVFLLAAARQDLRLGE